MRELTYAELLSLDAGTQVKVIRKNVIGDATNFVGTIEESGSNVDDPSTEVKISILNPRSFYMGTHIVTEDNGHATGVFIED